MTAHLEKDLRILLVIPTYNNRSSLRRVVEKAMKTSMPVLVVSDGSTDGGLRTLEGLSVFKIELPERMGKGVAIRAGGDWAEKKRFTHIITIDADGQHNPEEAVKFVNKIKEKPMSIVCGNRDFSSSEVPGASRFGRKFSNFWIKVSSGMKIPDSQCGFRAYPIEAIQRVKCRAKKYNYEVEILVKSIWAGLSVQSVDISVDYSKETTQASHFHPFLDNWRISLTYTRLVIRNFIPCPHKILFGVPHSERLKFFFLNPFKSLKMLATERTTAKEIGYATALGIFMGTLPLFSIHMVSIVFVSTRLKLNRLIALNVSHFCAPPVVPALAVEVGYFMRHGEFLTEFTFQTLGREFPQRLAEYLIGSVTLAFPLGALAGLLGYTLSLLFKKLKENRKGRNSIKTNV